MSTLIAVNLTGYDVEVSQENDGAVVVTVRSRRELSVRGVEKGLGRWSFGYRRGRHGAVWNAGFDMVRVDERVGEAGKAREVSVRLVCDHPASGFVVREDLRGFLYCSAAKLDIAGAFDLHVCLVASAASPPQVRSEKSMLTVSSEGAFAIAYLQPSQEGLEASVSCSGEGARSARLELERVGPFSLGLLGELSSVERLATVQPGQSARVAWSPANGPAEPVVLVTTVNDARDPRRFQRFLNAIGCRTRSTLFGGISLESGDLFVIGDHAPVRHSLSLVLDLPRRIDVRDKTELEVIG